MSSNIKNFDLSRSSSHESDRDDKVIMSEQNDQIDYIAFDGLIGTFEEVFERNNEEILRRAKATESHDSEIANLEWRVVIQAEKWAEMGGAGGAASLEQPLLDAVQELIKRRDSMCSPD